MAKKSSKSNRQAVIDEIRKKQKGAEKRRGYAIVGVCSLVALLIVAAAAYRPVKNWWDLRQFKDINLASIGAPASSCDKITTKPATGSSEHVPTNSNVTYDTAPPPRSATRSPRRRRTATSSTCRRRRRSPTPPRRPPSGRTGTSRASRPRRSTASTTVSYTHLTLPTNREV